MNCTRVRALLSSYYDAELEENTSAQVAEHLQRCAGCAAELDSWRALSEVVSSARVPAVAAHGWERIAARLDASQSTAVPSVSLGATRRHPAGATGRRLAIGLGLALAASLLLLASVRFENTSNAERGASASALAIDYMQVIQQQAKQPAQALEAVSNRFSGREVATKDIESALGYLPAILGALPAEARLVSTRLLKLPNCSCGDGRCRCGPTGCNCAACLCQRKDGSEFLVFEHCKTQDVSFGQLPSRIVARDARKVRIIESGKSVAVSWVPGARRLTAIGLRDEAEADWLVSAIDKTAAPSGS